MCIITKCYLRFSQSSDTYDNEDCTLVLFTSKGADLISRMPRFVLSFFSKFSVTQASNFDLNCLKLSNATKSEIKKTKNDFVFSKHAQKLQLTVA